MLNNKYTDSYTENEAAKSLSPELKAIWNETFECRGRIESTLRSIPSMVGKGFWGANADIPISAYLLSEAAKEKDPLKADLTLITSKLDASIEETVKRNRIDQVWPELLHLTKEFSREIFLLVANQQELSDPNRTPESISALAREILDISKKDTFADLCCGTGSVALSVKKDEPSADVTGYEISSDAISLAKIYNTIMETGITFQQKDVFELLLESDGVKKYSKVFANYPLGMRLRELNAGKQYLEILERRIPSISRATSSDWLYNMLLVDMLTENGKAIGIMTNGSTWNMIDAPIRKYFVEKGLIECVIALPDKVFPFSASVSMIVFSHNNNGVRLVDASRCYVPGRRTNEMDDECIRKIVEATKTDSDLSKVHSIDELRENDYVLNVSRYTILKEDIEDGVEFSTVIQRITRGAPLNARELDQLSSPVPTGIQYLMLANIHDGLIDTDLPYLNEPEDRYERYCLSDRCLILSKNGYPYKVAVAEIRKEQKIIANGNLYIIELDEKKANPYYLAAFFESEKGIAALKSITVGATIPSIGVKQLENLMIPIPDLKIQNEIADHYQALRDEMQMLQMKLVQTKSRMAHICEEGSGK